MFFESIFVQKHDQDIWEFFTPKKSGNFMIGFTKAEHMAGRVENVDIGKLQNFQP